MMQNNNTFSLDLFSDGGGPPRNPFLLNRISGCSSSTSNLERDFKRSSVLSARSSSDCQQANHFTESDFFSSQRSPKAGKVHDSLRPKLSKFTLTTNVYPLILNQPEPVMTVKSS